MDNEALHIVVFPWLAFGHMLPFLELSKSLAKRGHRVSFISTPRNLSRLPAIPSDLSPLIDLVSFTLPPADDLPAGAESTNDLHPEQVQFLKKAFDGLQIEFSQFIRATSRKPDWIVVDFAQHWAPAIASELKIQSACFLIFPALFISFLWGNVHGARKKLEEHGTVRVVRANASGITDRVRLMTVAKGCSLLAIRDCYEFDSIDWISLAGEICEKPFTPVGLLPPGVCGEEQVAAAADTTVSEARIFEWLSERSPRSVVYVAFGTEAVMSAEQEHELALGLELSKMPFLWALRRPAAERLPEAFEERTRDYGLIATGLVPQQKVLSHPSVGAFFSHCGWGSTIEGLRFGHPFIMMPFAVDQGPIARRLEEGKVGVMPPRDEDGSFGREGIAMTIKKVMVEEEGKTMRSNAQKLQEVFADTDLHESYIDNFVRQLRDHKERRTFCLCL